MGTYGNEPKNLGIIDAPTDEMMFWLYCPIMFPESANITLPTTLEKYRFFVHACLMNCDYNQKYVYLTAKTMHVTPENMGNRQGWHCDGFKTNDINFIWYDCAPTEFLVLENLIDLPEDCEEAYRLMGKAGTYSGGAIGIARYPDRSLILLNETVIHRVSPRAYSGMRTFLKLSISDQKYNLIGNSINHDLDYSWDLKARSDSRNHTSQ